MAHIHNIIDPDVHFIINSDTRDIVKETSDILKLMQCDHDSERVTFEIPRYVEGHDMLLSDEVLLYYTNTGTAMGSSRKTTNYGFYKVEDLEPLEDDPETLVGSWLISQNATLLAGPVKFQIKFSCLKDDTTGNTSYIWQTNQCGGIEVLPSITNTASVINLEPDAFLNLKAMVNGLGIESVEQTVIADGNEETNVITITQPNGKQWTFQVKNGSEGPRGVSGVYVGSGEMPEGYNVQVDPSAEESSLVEDLYAKLSELTDKYNALSQRVDYAEQNNDRLDQEVWGVSNELATLRDRVTALEDGPIYIPAGTYEFKETMTSAPSVAIDDIELIVGSLYDGNSDHAADEPVQIQVLTDGSATVYIPSSDTALEIYVDYRLARGQIGISFSSDQSVSKAFRTWFTANTVAVS